MPTLRRDTPDRDRRLVVTGVVGALALALAAPALASQRRFDARGVIKAIADDRTSLDIAHEAIPEFMPAMTMTFAARPAQLRGLAVGDRVRFTFEQTDDGDLVVRSIAAQA